MTRIMATDLPNAVIVMDMIHLTALNHVLRETSVSYERMAPQSRPKAAPVWHLIKSNVLEGHEWCAAAFGPDIALAVPAAVDHLYDPDDREMPEHLGFERTMQYQPTAGDWIRLPLHLATVRDPVEPCLSRYTGYVRDQKPPKYVHDIFGPIPALKHGGNATPLFSPVVLEKMSRVMAEEHELIRCRIVSGEPFESGRFRYAAGPGGVSQVNQRRAWVIWPSARHNRIVCRLNAVQD